ncbi:MAG: deoxyguanosinetriphosphate triphosphohydrolase [Elusimicrobia bacterium]|nr:deoxyguanosinetriphosphate triphosphohydrolase [Elusimicrobiota bacterium]
MLLRAQTEIWENEFLSEFASHSSRSQGRKVKEEPCSLRTEFQKDRDRIIHSLYFRLLKNKTQVYLSTTGERFRTRLSHTIEVSTVGRYIARALGLNTDLVEAIALGHDLGHTPFGHVGEETLEKLTPFKFKHSDQSLRVVEILENKGEGLNLTSEVKNGIVAHTKGTNSIFTITSENQGASRRVHTVEGEVVQFADWIAYINHDVDDAFNMGFITAADLPKSTYDILGHNFQERFVTMVSDVIISSKGQPHIRMSKKIMEATDELRRFLYDCVYELPQIAKKEEEAREIVKYLYGYYIENYDKVLGFMPYLKGVESARGVADFIASLTDNKAQDIYGSLKGNESDN